MSEYEKYFSPAGYPPPNQAQPPKVASGGVRKKKRSKKEIALDTAIGLGLAGAGIYAAKKYKPLQKIKSIFNPRIRAKREIFSFAPPQFFRELKVNMGDPIWMRKNEKYLKRFYPRSARKDATNYQLFRDIYKTVFDPHAETIAKLSKEAVPPMSGKLTSPVITRAQNAYQAALQALRNKSARKAHLKLIETGEHNPVQQFFTPEEIRNAMRTLSSKKIDKNSLSKAVNLSERFDDFNPRDILAFQRITNQPVIQGKRMMQDGSIKFVQTNAGRMAGYRNNLIINSNNADEWTGLINKLQTIPTKTTREGKIIENLDRPHMITEKEGFNQLASRLRTLRSTSRVPYYKRLPKFMTPPNKTITSSVVGVGTVGGATAAINKGLSNKNLTTSTDNSETN